MGSANLKSIPSIPTFESFVRSRSMSHPRKCCGLKQIKEILLHSTIALRNSLLLEVVMAAKGGENYMNTIWTRIKIILLKVFPDHLYLRGKMFWLMPDLQDGALTVRCTHKSMMTLVIRTERHFRDMYSTLAIGHVIHGGASCQHTKRDNLELQHVYPSHYPITTVLLGFSFTF